MTLIDIGKWCSNSGNAEARDLVRALHRRGTRERSWKAKRAAERLVQLGQAAVEPLLASLRESPAERFLGTSKHRCEVKQVIIAILGRIDDPRPTEALADILLHCMQIPLREDAAKALGMRGDAAAIEPLKVALSTGGGWAWGVHEEAAKALLNIRDPRSVSALISCLQLEGDDYRHCVAVARKALVSLGALAVGPLASLLSHPSEICKLKRNVAAILGEIGDTQAVAALNAALSDPDLPTAIEAAKSLGAIRDPRAVVPLTEFLPRLRSARDLLEVTRSVESLLDVRALRPLLEKLPHAYSHETSNDCWRSYAIWTMMWIKKIGQDAVEPLIAILYEARQGGNKALVELPIYTLCDLKDKRAAPMLIECLGHEKGTFDWRILAALESTPGAEAAVFDGFRRTRYRALARIIRKIAWPVEVRLPSATPTERASLLAMNGEWELAAKEGIIAFKPILDEAERLRGVEFENGHGLATRDALLRVLTELVRDLSANLQAEELHRLASLDDITFFDYRTLGTGGGCITEMDLRQHQSERLNTPPVVVECGYLRQLARQELIRRGLHL